MASFGKAEVQLATLNPDCGVPAPKVQEALHTAVDTVTEFGDQGIEFCTNSLSSALAKLSVISASVQSGEYDFDGSREQKPVQPIFLRAEEIKNEIKDASQLKYKLEARDIDIKDLKKLLRVKQEELSEMQVRKDLLEKKLSDSTKDSELMIEKLQRKLDDAHNLLRRKEKEFEETMDHLQADIDSLESERGELKDKVKQMSKKVLIQGISKQPNLEAGGPASLGPSIPSPVRDSPLLVQQVRDMRAAVASLQHSKARLQGQDIRERLAKLKPIKIPKKTIGELSEKTDKGKESASELGDLMRRCNTARSDLFSLLCSQSVVDLSRPPGTSLKTDKGVQERELREAALRSEVDKLSLKTAKLMTGKLDGGTVSSSFGSFASNSAARAVNEKEYTLMGRINLDGGKMVQGGPQQGGTAIPQQGVPHTATGGGIPLLLNIDQLKQIHTALVV